ncbi:PREDICTED: trafficking protein particle complex subunit 5 [Myotis brandtii]|uniref:trafficking protein particle complex subunit 5 n=1 Tax=Myotis brandtii TaxID=109478 RepID=UPI0003BB8851|nr:PREDICTED: trafficking protein particle complex subunit 5 [Myotis brandtii]
MEAEEIYINQAGMQAAAVKDKQRGTPANRKGVDDRDYVNIPVIVRKQDHPKGSHSPSKSEARSRPSSDSAQCLHKTFTSLYILLALISIILLVWVLVKNSEMSQELLVMKREISNVSISTRECEEGQRKGWTYVRQSISNTKQSIDLANRNVQAGNEKLKKLTEDITQIKTQLRQISETLKKMQNPRRETKVLGALLFVKGAVWKALFGKEADKLEQANDDARTFYIIEREPLINTYISVPKENSTLNCASFTAGIVEAVLTHSGFPAKVTAHWHKGTTLMIKFEEAVIARDRALEGR